MKEKAELHFGLFLFLFVIMITAAFGRSVRRVTSAEGANLLLKKDLITALVEAVIFGVATAIIVLLIKRKMNK